MCRSQRKRGFPRKCWSSERSYINRDRKPGYVLTIRKLYRGGIGRPSLIRPSLHWWGLSGSRDGTMDAEEVGFKTAHTLLYFSERQHPPLYRRFMPTLYKLWLLLYQWRAFLSPPFLNPHLMLQICRLFFKLSVICFSLYSRVSSIYKKPLCLCFGSLCVCVCLWYSVRQPLRLLLVRQALPKFRHGWLDRQYYRQS